MLAFFHGEAQKRVCRLAYVGFGLLIAILYDVFTWRMEKGLGFFAYVLIYLAGFLILTIVTNQFRQRWALFLLVPIIILSFDVVLYTNTFVLFFVPKIVFILLVIFSMVATLNNPNKYAFSFSMIPVQRRFFLIFKQWENVFRDIIAWQENSLNRGRRVLQGVIIALPLLVIFGLLFAGADKIFYDWITSIFDFQSELIWRIVRTIIFAFLIAGFYYVLISSDHILGHKPIAARAFDPISTSVALALLNSLFAIFVFIQFRYLFGASDFVLKSGLTYAQYARAGFFELFWVLCLAALILLVVYRSFSYNKRSRIVEFSQILFVVQVAIVALSALKRMNLYQSEYGFTVLRLYVEWFIYFVFVGLALATISIVVRWPFRNYFYTTLILGVMALALVASINVDRLIAKENIRRFTESGRELDVRYLAHLSSSSSADVVPELVLLLKDPASLARLRSTDDLVKVKEFFNTIKSLVERRTSWREFNFSVERANNLIRSIENIGQSSL